MDRGALAVTAAWAVAVFAFNLAAGTNYGYLNAKPAATTVLDLLGPWPWYLLSELAVVTAVWALATWPWTARSGAGGSGPPGTRRRGPLPRGHVSSTA